MLQQVAVAVAARGHQPEIGSMGTLSRKPGNRSDGQHDTVRSLVVWYDQLVQSTHRFALSVGMLLPRDDGGGRPDKEKLYVVPVQAAWCRSTNETDDDCRFGASHRRPVDGVAHNSDIFTSQPRSTCVLFLPLTLVSECRRSLSHERKFEIQQLESQRG